MDKYQGAKKKMPNLKSTAKTGKIQKPPAMRVALRRAFRQTDLYMIGSTSLKGGNFIMSNLNLRVLYEV